MFKKILLSVLLLVLPIAVCGAYYPHYIDTVQNIRGDAVAGATITVYLAGTTDLATLYNSGSQTKGVKTNPILSATNGQFDFYINAGIYDIAVSRPGVVDYTLEDVTISYLVSPSSTYNILDFGAIADDGIDDSAAIQAAIDACGAAGGGEVYIPAGTFLISSTINIMVSNITLSGEGAGASIIDDFEGVGGLGDNPLIEIGEINAGSYVENISFRDITFTNGIPQVNWVSNVNKLRSCITAAYVKDITIEKCEFVDIQGVSGFKIEDCMNVYVQDTLFQNMGYSGMAVYCDNKNVFVDNCVFDTNTVTEFEGTAVYLLLSGHDEQNDPDDVDYVENYWITNNVFKNNPLWEGIDIHGGKNVHILNNVIENCQTGIMAQLGARDYVTNQIMENIFIEGNIIDVTGNASLSEGIEYEARGIITGGDAVNLTVFPHGAKNIVVSGNTIIGGGDTELGDNDNVVSYGAITMRYCDGGVVSDNIMKDSQACGVYVREVGPLIVSGNTIADIVAGEEDTVWAFYLNATDLNHHGTIRNNLIDDSDEAINSAASGYVYVSSGDNINDGYKVQDNKVVGVISEHYYSAYATRLISSTTYNVMDFATIDNTGVVPCTEAMNAAIAEIISFAGVHNGVDIIIPPGHYRVDGVGIKVENVDPSNPHVFIDATGAEFIRYEDSDPGVSSRMPVFTIGKAGYYYARNITLIGGYYRYYSTANHQIDDDNEYTTQWGSYGSDCLRLINLTHGYIENVECYGGYTGILMAAWHGDDDVAFGTGTISRTGDYELELTDTGVYSFWERLGSGDVIEFHQLAMASGHEGDNEWDDFICSETTNALTVESVSNGVVTLSTVDSMSAFDTNKITEVYWAKAPASGFGNAYNTIISPRVVDCRNGIRLLPNTSSGWVNENNFDGGSIAYSGSTHGNYPDYDDAGRALYLSPDNRCGWTINNNRFHDISIESNRPNVDGPAAIRECGSFGTADAVSGNFYINNRYEGMTNGDTELLDFGPTIDNNIRPGNKSAHSMTLKGVHGIYNLHDLAAESEIIGGVGLPFSGSHLELKDYKRFSGGTQLSAAVWGDQTRTIFEVDNRSTIWSPSIAARGFNGFQTGVELYGGGLIWMSPIHTDPDNIEDGLISAVDHRFGESSGNDADDADEGSSGYMFYSGTTEALRFNDGDEWNSTLSTRNKLITNSGALYDLDTTGYGLIVCDPTDNLVVVSTVGHEDGRVLQLLNISDSYIVTLANNQVEFELGGDVILDQYDTVSLISYDGVWYKLSNETN